MNASGASRTELRLRRAQLGTGSRVAQADHVPSKRKRSSFVIACDLLAAVNARNARRGLAGRLQIDRAKFEECKPLRFTAVGCCTVRGRGFSAALVDDLCTHFQVYSTAKLALAVAEIKRSVQYVPYTLGYEVGDQDPCPRPCKIILSFMSTCRLVCHMGPSVVCQTTNEQH